MSNSRQTRKKFGNSSPLPRREKKRRRGAWSFPFWAEPVESKGKEMLLLRSSFLQVKKEEEGESAMTLLGGGGGVPLFSRIEHLSTKNVVGEGQKGGKEVVALRTTQGKKEEKGKGKRERLNFLISWGEKEKRHSYHAGTETRTTTFLGGKKNGNCPRSSDRRRKEKGEKERGRGHSERRELPSIDC